MIDFDYVNDRIEQYNQGLSELARLGEEAKQQYEKLKAISDELSAELKKSPECDALEKANFKKSKKFIRASKRSRGMFIRPTYIKDPIERLSKIYDREHLYPFTEEDIPSTERRNTNGRYVTTKKEIRNFMRGSKHNSYYLIVETSSGKEDKKIYCYSMKRVFEEIELNALKETARIKVQWHDATPNDKESNKILTVWKGNELMQNLRALHEV